MALPTFVSLSSFFDWKLKLTGGRGVILAILGEIARDAGHHFLPPHAETSVVGRAVGVAPGRHVHGVTAPARPRA